MDILFKLDNSEPQQMRTISGRVLSFNIDDKEKRSLPNEIYPFGRPGTVMQIETEFDGTLEVKNPTREFVLAIVQAFFDKTPI